MEIPKVLFSATASNYIDFHCYNIINFGKPDPIYFQYWSDKGISVV